jgi:hypothetical protein
MQMPYKTYTTDALKEEKLLASENKWYEKYLNFTLE